MTITVNKQEFVARLDELFALVEGGAEVVVRDGMTKAFRLTLLAEPELKPQQPRIFGLHAGRGWMAPDFDAPMKLVPDVPDADPKSDTQASSPS